MAAEPVMDNPLSPAPTIGAHYAKLLQDVKDCIAELKQEFDDSGGIPINDDIQPLHRLCAKLEYLLQAGLKAKTTLLGGKKDYWNYFLDCLNANKSLNDGIRFVKSISELHSSLGRGRAFLRYCLVQQRLADTLQHCVGNLRLTSEWYHPKAFWFDRRLVSEFLNLLYDLNDLQFDLSPRGYDLDASWPTFARRTLGSPYSWKPPSRTTSIASLSSIPAMDNLSFSASPQTSTDPEVLKLQSEVTDARSKTQEVSHQLESAENEKLAAELKLEHANKEQEVVQKRNNDLENEIAVMKNKMETLRAKCTEFEIQNDKLSQELKLKEEVWKEKEEILKVQASEAEKLLGEFRDDVQVPDKAGLSTQKIDMMELRGQIVVQKKKNQTLEINLKSTQMELDAKERVNQKKTELIDLLDRKLQQQKQKIDYLLGTAENLVKEKETQSKKLSSASSELMKLSKKYVESEKLQGDLRKTNKELKAMLTSLEGKGKQLVGLAKDKVKSYTDQNKKLQDEVDDLKQEMKGKDAYPLSSNIKELEEGLSKTCREILQQVSALVSKENLDNQGQAELSQIQIRLKNLEETKSGLSKSLEGSLAQEVESLKQKVEESKNELTKEKETLNAQIAALREENGKLKKDSDEVKKEVSSVEGQGQSDSGDVETLKQQLKDRNDELERVKSELGAIRALVLQSVTGATPTNQDEVNVDDTDDIGSITITTDDTMKDTLSYLKEILPKVDNSSHGDFDHPEVRVRGGSEPITEAETSHVTALLLENAQLKTQISQEDILSADVQKKYDESQDELKKTSAILEQLTNDFSQVSNEKEELVTMMDNLSEQIAEKDRNILELTRKVEKYQTELEGLKNSHDATVAEKNDLHEHVQATESKMTEMEDNFLVLVKGIEDLKDENGALLCEKEDFEAEVEGLELDKKELQQLVSKLEANVEHTVEEKLTSLREQIQSEKEECKTLNSAMEQLKLDMVEKDDKLSEMNKLRDEAEMDFSQKLDVLKSEVKTLNERNSSLKSEVEQKTKEKIEVDLNLQSMEAELAKVKEDANELKRNLSRHEEGYSSLEVKLADTEGKLKEEREIRTEIENKAKDFNFQFLTTKSDVEQKASKVEELQESISSKDQEIQQLKDQIKTKEEDKVVIRDELEEARNVVKELQLEVTTKRERTPEASGSVTVECLQQQAVVVPSVQVENVDLRQQIQTLLADKDEMCRNLVEDKAALNDHLDLMIKDVEEKSRAFENMQIEYQNLETELGKSKSDCEDKGEAIKTLMENIEKAKGEMEDLRSKATSLPEREAEVKSLKEDVAILKEGMAKSKKDWESEKDGWEKEASALRFQMSAQEMEYQETIKTLHGKLEEKTGLESQIHHQDALVETLELELRQLREEKDQEQDRGCELHKELQGVLKENKQLSRELVLTNEVLQSERRESSKLKESLSEHERHLSDFAVTHQEETSLLEGDNVELKKRLIQLIREKDVLWQKIAKLEHEKNLRRSDVWLDSSQVHNCMACNTEFSILLRKHHCRLCGRIFCRDCCNNWVMTPHSSKQERVCQSCLMSHSQLEPSTEPDTADKDFLQTVEIPQKKSSKWSESNSTAAVTAEEDDLGLRSAEAISKEPEGGSTDGLALNEDKLLSMTDDIKSEAMQTGSLPIQRTESEDAYDLITDDEIIQSMCEPIPDPNVDFHETISVEQILRGDVICPPELWIPAGKSYVVPVFLDEVGASLHWEFSTKPKGISFSLTYKENTFVTVDNQETLVPVCKCNSHKEAVTGDLTARKPGVYSLVFDNMSSRFTSKKLDFSLSVARAGSYVT